MMYVVPLCIRDIDKKVILNSYDDAQSLNVALFVPRK